MKKIILVIAYTFISSCMFIGLSEDVAELNAAITITGKIVTEKSTAAPIVVTLSRFEDGEYPLQGYTVVYGASEFLFAAPVDEYYLFAFEDLNQDFTLQENERVGWYDSASMLQTRPGKTYDGINIRLLEPDQARVEHPGLFIPEINHERVSDGKTNIGVLVGKSELKKELGALGMWNPVEFHNEGNSGIFFFEPYDKNKTPVMFVHGLGGSGYDWLYLIDALDKERFQPWIVQYPSGIRLDLISKSLSQSVDELKAIYNPNELVVVAHSMGGLISRGFINHQLSVEQKDNNIVNTFVTLSTPWLGHTAASQGAKYAPVVVPSWFDLVPGSAYLNSLYETPESNEINYYLLFSHKNEGSGLLNRSSTDGTVTVRSQLSADAQSAAVKIIGYDEDHIGILNSEDVAKKLNEIMK